jgi:hypothetical protein
VLKDVQAVGSSWNWFARKLVREEGVSTVNTARLIVPDNIQGAVVMDATAPGRG